LSNRPGAKENEDRDTLTDEERIDQLERQIVELKARLPRHSVPPAMLIELEDLEEEIKLLKTQGKDGIG
jgi:hypothetical protein